MEGKRTDEGRGRYGNITAIVYLVKHCIQLGTARYPNQHGNEMGNR